jgi:hypothetical protein
LSTGSTANLVGSSETGWTFACKSFKIFEVNTAYEKLLPPPNVPKIEFKVPTPAEFNEFPIDGSFTAVKVAVDKYYAKYQAEITFMKRELERLDKEKLSLQITSVERGD